MDAETSRPRLADELIARYGVARSAVRQVFAPYRICPLGAHIDHQLGSVTAMAIDHGVLFAYAPGTAREVRLRSMDFTGEVRFDLDAPGTAREGDWGNYARGAVHALTQAGYGLKQGLVGIIAGPWSEGGLGSSAAVGVAYLLALESRNRLSVSPDENIRLDQAIERGYLGLRNGILDQSGILLSRKNHLTLIDCATGEHQLIPAAKAMPSWSILLAFSGLQKALTGTDYNRRVAECAEAARIMLESAGRKDEPPLLGRIRPAEYERFKDRLPPPLDRRAEHFFSEIDRVQKGIVAWARGDLNEFGRLMTASGESSIRLYECGAPPLIDLYQIIVQCPRVYGARFSGAGFRGCCVALVEQSRASQAAAEIQAAYAGRQPELAAKAAAVMCLSDDGARMIS
jgi:galacturonokinase